MLRIANNRYFVWIVLALPSFPLILDFVHNQRYYSGMMYDSGVLSVQLLVFNLALTPLYHLVIDWSPGRRTVRWFSLKRRYIGIACFGYAVIHTLTYIRETGDLENILWEAQDWEILIGWAALLILLALALTSNNLSVRWLGRKWKNLHRLVYLATLLTALHWYLFNIFIHTLLLIFAPLAILYSLKITTQKNRKPTMEMDKFNN